MSARGFSAEHSLKNSDELLKAEDPSGEKRRVYVYGLLEELGVVITDIIKAKIEANVLKMPKE